MSYLQAATLFALTALVSAVEVAQAAVPTDLTYMGRLIDATGKPLAGPVDLEASFYRAADGGDAVGGTVLQFPGVTLNKGVFQIDLKLTDSEMHVIFDNSSDVYVQIVDKTNRKTYARQKYGVVPYALKVPTDNSTIVYDSSGRLTLGKRPSVGFTTSTSGTVYLKPGTGSADGLTYTLPATPVAGQFLTTDANGTLSWTPMASVAISSLPTGVNANQIPLLGTGGTLPAVDGSLLTNLNGSRLSASSLNLSTSTAVAGTLPIASGGTGLGSTPTNGQILVGNGTGFTLSNIAAGTGMTVTNAAGTITIATSADASLMVKKDGSSQLTGPWNVGGQDITNTGSMALAASKTLGLGVYAVDPTLVVADKGKVWFNSATGQMKYWDGTAVQALGVSGSGLTSLNSQTGSSQTFAAGSTGTAPAIASSANTHTLNVPFASAASVTAGVISNTDYAAFTAKQAAGNYLTALTGDITAAGPGSGAATLANSGVTAGSYTKVTVDAKGRVTAGTSLAAADIPTHSAASIGSGTLGIAFGGTGTGATPTNGQLLIGNGTGFTLAALTGGTGFSVVNAAGTITLNASADASLKLTKAGDTMSGTLVLPNNGLAAGTTQLVISSGNVGIGTSSPQGILHVAGATTILGVGEGATPSGATLRGASATGTNILGANLTIQASNGTGTGGSGAIVFQTAPVAGTGSAANTLATAMTILPTGNVGIGSATPGAALDVNGSVKFGSTGTVLSNSIVTCSFASTSATSTAGTCTGATASNKCACTMSVANTTASVYIRGAVAGSGIVTITWSATTGGTAGNTSCICF